MGNLLTVMALVMVIIKDRFIFPFKDNNRIENHVLSRKEKLYTIDLILVHHLVMTLY